MKRRWLRTVLFGLCLTTSAATQAELINISTNTFQSGIEEATVCTIIGASGKSWKGMKILVVLSEGGATNSDTYLKVRNLTTGKYITNDDWLGMVVDSEFGSYKPQSTVADWLWRKPGKLRDAGVLIWGYPGEAICAFSSEEKATQQRLPVSLSITDVTERSTDATGFPW